MKIAYLKKQLQDNVVILMDGAVGSEIFRRGISTSLPLWSAEVLLSKPEIVQQIHEDYIKNGAEIIIANTFSTTGYTFAKKGIREKAPISAYLACQLAHQAVEHSDVKHPVFIAGSVAPIEDCYSPQLTPSQKVIATEQKELIEQLKKGNVDFILFETMITLPETLSGLKIAKKFNMPVAVSFCCNEEGNLLGGESLLDAIHAVESFNPIFIGVNCVSIPIATKVVRKLKKISPFPICVYAQGDGEVDNKEGWIVSETHRERKYISAAKQWLKDGAQIIGGCCGTSPSYIERLSKLLQTY